MSDSGIRKAKHQEILETLLGEIDSGVYSEGDQLPTEFKLADRFSVSRPTVARAVQELVRMGLVRRRAGHGTFVLPRPAEECLTFGLLLPDSGDEEVQEQLGRRLSHHIRRLGHSVLVANTALPGQESGSRQSAEEVCRTLIQTGVAGIFMAPYVAGADAVNPNRPVLSLLQDADIPVVLLDRDIVRFPDRSQYDLVGADHTRAQARLTWHLVQRGFRRIGFWGWQQRMSALRLRQAGMLQTLLEAGLGGDQPPAVAVDPASCSRVRQLLDQQQPDAIMCADDVFAGQLMRTLETLQVRIPEDLAIAGYHDVHYAQLLRVPLTTIAQPVDAIAAAAVQLMLSRREAGNSAGRELLLNPELTVRESTNSSHLSR